MVSEVLFEATFAADALPAGDVEATFYRLTLPPGAGLPFLAGPLAGPPGFRCACADAAFAPGVGAETVLSGAYALRLDAPVLVRRGGPDGAEEAVPPGTPATLGPGDVAVYPEYAAAGEVRNAGEEPLAVVGISILAGEATGTPVPDLPPGAAARLLSRLSPSTWAQLPAGPRVVTLRRLRLPPGARLGPYELAGPEALHVEAGELEADVIPPGATTPTGRPLVLVAGGTAPFLAPGAGQEVIASTGDEPAAVLVLTIAPATEASPGTPTP